MAAQLKNDRGYLGVHTVRRGDFAKMVKSCESEQKASPALKEWVATGKTLVKKD